MLLNPGQIICEKMVFGPCHRYAVAPVYTRFKTVEWFVWDAYERDPINDDKAGIIRQSEGFTEAVKGLDWE